MEKKLRRTIFLWQLFCLILLILLAFYAEKAKASTIELVPSSQSALVGQEFSVQAFIVPDSTNYTVNMRMAVHGANFVSWDMPEYWLQLPVPYYWQNYDWGISRTAGFPGGFSKKILFGTARFVATESGPVHIKVEENSLILDASNQNVIK